MKLFGKIFLKAEYFMLGENIFSKNLHGESSHEKTHASSFHANNFPALFQIFIFTKFFVCFDMPK